MMPLTNLRHRVATALLCHWQYYQSWRPSSVHGIICDCLVSWGIYFIYLLDPVANFNFSGHQYCKDCSNKSAYIYAVYLLAFILVYVCFFDFYFFLNWGMRTCLHHIASPPAPNQHSFNLTGRWTSPTGCFLRCWFPEALFCIGIFFVMVIH
jgi:hypothetical protein